MKSKLNISFGMLYRRWRKALRNRHTGGGSKQP